MCGVYNWQFLCVDVLVLNMNLTAAYWGHLGFCCKCVLLY